MFKKVNLLTLTNWYLAWQSKFKTTSKTCTVGSPGASSLGPLGPYPLQDINLKHFGASTAPPHAKCQCNPTCHTLLRFRPSLSNHSRVLGIQPGKAGHAIRAWKERQPDRRRQLRGTFTVRETRRKETTYRHYIMAMCLSTHSIHTDSDTMVAVWLPKSVQLTETYGRQREKRGWGGVERITERKRD